MEIFEQRLKQAMFTRRIKQAELAEITGIKEGKISSYVNGKYKPNARTLSLIAKALEVSPDWLIGVQEEPAVLPSRTKDWLKGQPDIMRYECTEEEHNLLVKYNAIDDRGKETVSMILDLEYSRCKGGAQLGSISVSKDYIYVGKIAAAGTWVYPGDIPTERIIVSYKEGADFIVGVSGDSMAPTYNDGDRLYVEKISELAFGDIGLFIVAGMYYIKEYAPDGLRSHNPKYALIPKDEEIVVVGKVLGKVEK